MEDRYRDRFYRDWVERGDLARFRVTIQESDLFILCDRAMPRAAEAAEAALREARDDLERYIARDARFVPSLVPVRLRKGAPPVAAEMARAARPWKVGPMAAVAGAIAEAVGRRLLEECETVIVENGGDVFAQAPEPLRFGLYAGPESPFAGRIAFTVDARQGLGVCTSSGVVGPSLSFGKADAVVAIAPGAAFADAAATAIGNRIHSEDDVDRVVEEEKRRGALTGLIACRGERLGLFGALELAE